MHPSIKEIRTHQYATTYSVLQKDSLVFVDSSSLLIASKHSVLLQQTPPPCQYRWFGSVLLVGLIFIG